MTLGYVITHIFVPLTCSVVACWCFYRVGYRRGWTNAIIYYIETGEKK